MSNKWIAPFTVLFVILALSGANASQEPGVDLIVRTVNTLQGDPYYPRRLLGIAREFKRDWPMSIGLIGMQEVKQDMDRCLVGSETGHGAKCFAAIMKETYGGNATT